eukprot:TRINITY_DN19666_c0_g1_i1.p1 TRINITY_DN19666_c0_g1~~TRINITY_DN19666_c0_g1_i1.p1  ORF type:complete len:228 (-),score=83.76 TRINITY_DN19666_c0_g1_i1:631-1314(-)
MATPAAETNGKGLNSLTGLENSLRETLKKEAQDAEKRQKAVEIQKQAWDQTRQVMSVPKELEIGADSRKEDQANAVVQTVAAKEEVINRKKQEMQGKVHAHLTRINQEAKRLDDLGKEIAALGDPTKREVADIRRQIENVDRELRPLKAMCEKKEKELKDAVGHYNEKSKQKTELVGRLMEIVTESERIRLQKLDELNRSLEAWEKSTSNEVANGSRRPSGAAAHAI